jgi:hypothetical protein
MVKTFVRDTKMQTCDTWAMGEHRAPSRELLSVIPAP